MVCPLVVLTDVSTFVIGPLAVLADLPEYEDPLECELPAGDFDTNPAIDWLTPSANMKFSLSSKFVRPFAGNKKDIEKQTV